MRIARRPGGAVRRHAECLGRKPPQGGHRQAGRGLRHPAGKRAAVPLSARSGMGLPGHRLLRMHRQLLRLRPVRARASIGLFPGRAGGDVRAGHPGGMPPHPAVRQLVAWHRANLPWWRRLVFELRVAAVWMSIAWERVVLARSMDAKGDKAQLDSNFTASSAGAVSPVEIEFRDLMMLCLQENDRRFAGYDSRLLRPTTIPALARFALFVTSRGRAKRRRRQSSPRAEPAIFGRVPASTSRPRLTGYGRRSLSMRWQSTSCHAMRFTRFNDERIPAAGRSGPGDGRLGLSRLGRRAGPDRPRVARARAGAFQQPARQSRGAGLRDRGRRPHRPGIPEGRDARRPLPVPCRGGLSLLGARSFDHPARQRRGHAQPDARSAGGRRRTHRLYQQRRGAQGRGRHEPGRRDGAAWPRTRPSAPTSAARPWRSARSRR